MKVRIESAELGAVYGLPFYLDESDLELVTDCPACRNASKQLVISTVEGTYQQGLALSRCGDCSHVYLSTRPTQTWFQKYYQLEWDTGKIIGVKSRLEKIKSLSLFKEVFFN